MANLLIVDDEEMIKEVIKEYALKENFKVFLANDGNKALELLKRESIDLMILDIMIPKFDGFNLLKCIPQEQKVPTIVLSARNSEFDKLKGFELGIDDYMSKPFSPLELMARCKAIINRTKGFIDCYNYKNLIVNFKEHTVKINNNKINITPKEFQLLEFFISNKQIAISREQLLNKIWGYDFYGDDRTIDTHIKMLRNNLLEYRFLIKTVRGIGYKFDEEE